MAVTRDKIHISNLKCLYVAYMYIPFIYLIDMMINVENHSRVVNKYRDREHSHLLRIFSYCIS